MDKKACFAVYCRFLALPRRARRQYTLLFTPRTLRHTSASVRHTSASSPVWRSCQSFYSRGGLVLSGASKDWSSGPTRPRARDVERQGLEPPPSHHQDGDAREDSGRTCCADADTLGLASSWRDCALYKGKNTTIHEISQRTPPGSPVAAVAVDYYL